MVVSINTDTCTRTYQDVRRITYGTSTIVLYRDNGVETTINASKIQDLTVTPEKLKPETQQ